MLSIQTNMSALNVARQFNLITKKREKNSEKLASGYRINRAADDAAGLSMSETMRRLVRGLQKGSENITEGISLIKVADAALGEITDMLQRVNELSVHAYNGTNTAQDREAVQAEIDQLLKEIGRTGDATVYNEIKVLKWELSFTREVVIREDQVLTVPVTMVVKSTLPKWLDDRIDDKLEVHTGYENLTDAATGGQAQQDTSGVMITLKKDLYGNIERDAEGTAKYIYYGPDYGNSYGEAKAEYAGRWTPSLSDNATAKVSYAGLKQYDRAEDLYGALISLLGGGFGVSCGTCVSRQCGINFVGSVDGIMVDAISPYYEDDKGISRSTPNLDLSGLTAFTDTDGNKVNCFDKIKDLVKTQKQNAGLTDAQKKQQVQDLAAEIARELSKKTFELMSGDLDMKDHYTKSFLTSDYDIVVYDYRDNRALTSLHAADTTVRKWASTKITYPAQYLEPGAKGTVEIPHDLYIVCSAQDSDDIPIELPYISLEKLGILGYNVAHYSRIEEYGEDYKKKLREWESSAYEQTTTTKEMVPDYDWKTEMLWIDGELRTNHTRVQKGMKEMTFTSSKMIYPYARPQAGDGDIKVTEWYDPSDNRLIKDALLQISMWRTNLGATQNRLEHTYDNNGNKEENLTAADSRIRDTDMAKETVEFFNNNILQQAGVSMLAHADHDRQLVLSLLQ